jgi:hypothetical protein
MALASVVSLRTLNEVPLAGTKGQLRWKEVHLQVTTGSYPGNGLTSENHQGISQSG